MRSGEMDLYGKAVNCMLCPSETNTLVLLSLVRKNFNIGEHELLFEHDATFCAGLALGVSNIGHSSFSEKGVKRYQDHGTVNLSYLGWASELMLSNLVRVPGEAIPLSTNMWA